MFLTYPVKIIAASSLTIVGVEGENERERERESERERERERGRETKHVCKAKPSREVLIDTVDDIKPALP